MSRLPSLLLNLGHALDHLFLLIFATAVVAIARDFGVARWEDLMPWTAGAFVMFGLGSVPAGRLGDLWGRRRMMLVFFFGMGLAAFAVAATRTPLQLGIALSVLGAFAAIYHPVGIPMLLRHSTRPGLTIGVNGLAGNLGIALAAVSTGLLVEHVDWRAAFVVPGLVSIAAGIAFALSAPPEAVAPGRQARRHLQLPRALALQTFGVMIVTATTGSFVFNLTTNGNAQLLAARLQGIVEDAGTLGALLAGIYVIAAFSQVLVGRLLDRLPLKPLFLGVVLLQAAMFAWASQASGWAWYVAATACMVGVFGAIPFSDAIVVRYVDDSLRSRVSGVRLAIAFGISSLAVYALGPLVKSQGFAALQLGMAGIALLTATVALVLPGEKTLRDATAPALPADPVSQGL